MEVVAEADEDQVSAGRFRSGVDTPKERSNTIKSNTSNCSVSEKAKKFIAKNSPVVEKKKKKHCGSSSTPSLNYH